MKFREPGELNEKEIQWKTLEQELEKTIDGRGKRVDEKIKFPVIALQANDFATTASCEGHKDRGLPWPWIDVESALELKLMHDARFNELKEKAWAAFKKTGDMTESEKEEYAKLQRALMEENEKEHNRLLGVLTEFYDIASEASQVGVRLGIWKRPANQSRLQPADIPERIKGVDVQKIWSDEEKEKRLRLYREEFDRFGSFLKQKFLSK